MAQKRVKQIFRVISKKNVSNPAMGLFTSAEVEDYLSGFINDGWQLVLASVTNPRFSLTEHEDLGVEMFYILVLPDGALPLESAKAKK